MSLRFVLLVFLFLLSGQLSLCFAQQQVCQNGRCYFQVPPPYSPAELAAARINGNNCHGSECPCPDTNGGADSRAGVFVPTTCSEPNCQFSNIQALAHSRGSSCTSKLRANAKKNSPWKDLNQFARFKLTLALAKKHALDYEQYSNHLNVTNQDDWRAIKPEMMTCIAARETGGTLEPLSISLSNCLGAMSTQAGLGAQVRRYYNVAVTSGLPIGNQKIPFIPHSQSQANTQYKNYDNLTADPELQLDFMSYYLSAGLSLYRGQLRDHEYDQAVRIMAAAYNGSSTRAAYGRHVLRCTKCLDQLRIDKRNSFDETDVSTCMKRANGSR